LNNNPRYLDLTDLDLDCIQGNSDCKVLTWVRVDVPGGKPGTGFGAGVLLDPLENLWIIGGADYTDAAFIERKELFYFHLPDPYFKHCSATGASLKTGVAGVKSIFFLQCQDNFMRPAESASFTVAMKGPVSLLPGIVELGGGKYSCSFTPVKMGTYTISVSVGRGGAQYQDLITGLDSVSSNNVLEGEFSPQCSYDANNKEICSTPAQNPYTLEVLPGPLSPGVTEAAGTYLTLSTAGVVSKFVITAKDAFSNRRPGGDIVAVLMELWACDGISVDNSEGVNKCLQQGKMEIPGLSPETGTVTDNSDGSYDAQYAVTRAGQYHLSIQLAGTTGANSPFILTIYTDVAARSMTYAYGDLKSLSAGKTSALYVQTRDKFGNAIRADLVEYPLGEIKGGTEGIKFELCFDLGSETSDPCGGGRQYVDVGITITYSIGPDGQQRDPDTKEPYWGLYQVVYFPFGAVSVTMRVLHGDKELEGGETQQSTQKDPATVVQCYYDTAGIKPVRKLMDPGDAIANKCILNAAAAETSARRVGRRYAPPQTLFQISPRYTSSDNDDMHQDLESPMNENDEMSRRVDSSDDTVASWTLSPYSPWSFGSSSSLSWRRVSLVKAKDNFVDIKTTFTAPDTSAMKLWAFLAPLICAGIGICLGCGQMAVELYERNRRIKITEAAFTNNTKEFDANRDGSPETEEKPTTSSKHAVADAALVLVNSKVRPSDVDRGPKGSQSGSVKVAVFAELLVRFSPFPLSLCACYNCL
jgi:hypothetical protein